MWLSINLFYCLQPAPQLEGWWHLEDIHAGWVPGFCSWLFLKKPSVHPGQWFGDATSSTVSSYLQKFILWAVKVPQSPESPKCLDWVSIIFFFIGINSPAWEKKEPGGQNGANPCVQDWDSQSVFTAGQQIHFLLPELSFSNQGSPQPSSAGPGLLQMHCQDCFKSQEK